MKTLKEISKTGIPDTKWCLEKDVKKMFDDYNNKIKELVTNFVGMKHVLHERIKQLSKEVIGE